MKNPNSKTSSTNKLRSLTIEHQQKIYGGSPVRPPHKTKIGRPKTDK